MTDAYLRVPDVHGDHLVFTAADDVWLAPVGGGRAWRLSDDASPVTTPRFSPDGDHVAWISRRDGHTEVMVVPTEGGTSERLTWFGTAGVTVLGWTANGRVLVASGHLDGPRRRNVVHAVSLDGSVERLAYGPASGLAIHPKGAVALSTPWSRPPAHWKRYRGGTAPRLWLDPKGKGKWQRLLPDVDASLVSPLWIGDDLVFASDHAATFPDRADEQANLWAIGDRGTGELRQITKQDHRIGYVRDPASDGQRIVWHSRGELFLLDTLGGRSRRLDITLGGSVAGRRIRSVVPTDQLTSIRPDHGANASVIGWRGTAWYLAHREGPARVVAATPGVRTREPRLLGSTGRALTVHTGQRGDDVVAVHDLGTPGSPRTISERGLGRILHVEPNPSGTTAVTISHDGRIRLLDVDTGRFTDLGHSRNGEAAAPAWSPDGRYVVWTQPVHSEGHNQLVGADVRQRKPRAVALTAGRFGDLSPSFSRDGKHLMFLSARTFDPQYSSFGFELYFNSAIRPYLIPLAATEPAPFGPSADGWRISAEEPASPTTKAEAGSPPPAAPVPESPDWDLDGFEERLVAFPVPSGEYRDLRAVKDGVVWIHAAGDRGELGTRRAGTTAEPADAVESFSFVKRKLEVLVDKADSFEVSGDGERIVVREGETVTVRPVDRVVKTEEPDCVTVDLSRLRMDVDPVTERRQMFDETVLLMTQHYWRADMNGVDWPKVTERYRDALERVATNDDLVDLLWEVVGELNTSHAYVMPPAEPGDTARKLGLLGAEFEPSKQGWRITRILPGETSDPEARSPLRAAGIGAAVGDIVTAIDGVAVDERFGPAASLVGAADKPIELTLRRGRTSRRAVVVPLATEETLRYQDWVRGRAEYTREHSEGRLGYVHIPDMMSIGWAQLYRDLEAAVRREGLIVDVRYNRGGHTSQLVLARLVQRVVGWVAIRDMELPEAYPGIAPRGPVVFVANEHAGSDGDIVNAGAQAMGIGPVVGTRTWGGVVGIDGRYSLVDGTEVSQPRYAFWLQGKDWDVENYGVEPDIEVEIAPAEHLREHEVDRQLDRAIEEALRLLADRPAASPPPLPAPRVR